MIDVEKAIEESKKMKNISVASTAGSECYDFGNVILLEYRNTLDWSEPRSDAEKVIVEANKKMHKE